MENESTKVQAAQQETRLAAALVLGALGSAIIYSLAMLTAVLYIVVIESGSDWPSLYWVVALPGATAALTLKLHAASCRGQLDADDR